MKQDGLVTKLPPVPDLDGYYGVGLEAAVQAYGHACIEAYIEWQLEHERRIEAIYAGREA